MRNNKKRSKAISYLSYCFLCVPSILNYITHNIIIYHQSFSNYILQSQTFVCNFLLINYLMHIYAFMKNLNVQKSKSARNI